MIRPIIFVVAVFFMVMDFSSCTPDSNVDPEASAADETIRSGNAQVGGCHTFSGKESIAVAGVTIDVNAPEAAYQGDMLILHAWDETPASWCLRSRICSKASSKGYRLIMPAMGKSIYTRECYAETRPDWQEFHSAAFFIDTLLPALRSEYCLLKEQGYNFVIGVSAGARGAVRLVQELPDLFVSAAALSGEYDPSQMQRDNIYRGFLGDYEDHPERWNEAENLTSSVRSMRTPLYLGHGKRDDFVPYTQTERLYNVLRREVPDLNARLNLSSDRGGSYAYWNYEVNNIFRFFEQAQADLPEAP
jgi:pimeloyl-ACP methyl ester carboxylesterase